MNHVGVINEENLDLHNRRDSLCLLLLRFKINDRWAVFPVAYVDIPDLFAYDLGEVRSIDNRSIKMEPKLQPTF